jgi:hypothetical protein
MRLVNGPANTAITTIQKKINATNRATSLIRLRAL